MSAPSLNASSLGCPSPAWSLTSSAITWSSVGAGGSGAQTRSSAGGWLASVGAGSLLCAHAPSASKAAVKVSLSMALGLSELLGFLGEARIVAAPLNRGAGVGLAVGPGVGGRLFGARLVDHASVIGAFGNAEADDSDDDGEPDERDFDPALGHSEMQRELSNDSGSHRAPGARTCGTAVAGIAL
jgi:hypothetical protein